MEHQVFVPVPAERLREALGDSARVARAIPGLQQDVGTEPVAGRLKVRVGGHTITYRGALRIAGQEDGSYSVEGEATEARGTGTVKLSLSLRLVPVADGTTVAFTGTATGEGRIAELPGDTVTSSAARLLARFAENLGKPGTEAGASPEEAADKGSDAMSDAAREGSRKPQGAAAEPSEAAAERAETPVEPPEASAEPPAPSVFDTDVPLPSLDPFADEDRDGGDLVPDEFGDEDEPPAEAAHARRTMIGRSAEEVDHAPPRGRYAPVPATETTTATETLRWAAPAAVVIVASVIVAGRMLRRRR